MLRPSPALVVVLVALGVWAAGLLRARWLERAGTPASRPEWQHSFLELTDAQQRLYRELREGLYDVENARSASGRWPAPRVLAEAGVPPFASGGAWTVDTRGAYVNYVGEAEGLRWLVLFIEPPPGLLRAPDEPPPPTDEEHHTLPDGTLLHVTVWTAGMAQAAPAAVLDFPVSQGWVQRVGR